MIRQAAEITAKRLATKIKQGQAASFQWLMQRVFGIYGIQRRPSEQRYGAFAGLRQSCTAETCD